MSIATPRLLLLTEFASTAQHHGILASAVKVVRMVVLDFKTGTWKFSNSNRKDDVANDVHSTSWCVGLASGSIGQRVGAHVRYLLGREGRIEPATPVLSACFPV